MACELIKTKEDALAIFSDPKTLGEVIRPLSREILLFETYIAGTMHLKDKSVLEDIKAGDKLILQRENNRFDENAILVLNTEKKKLGYIPERYNLVFARLMDAGKPRTAKIKFIDEEENGFKIVNIEIFLVDF